ncbi:CBS domain-containing protein [Kibdelosporangium philippinense]|uniref:CBS domain-containing protein n=1 Tax=Kibdelosporangium philippinense TaxID=211113 RepID=A0ABS8Z8C2_9PSEU|nr:CBS domain-containing protein [Kibdelosporangium philippinense]MCE7002082.1 CBS domain-containing protein [Kibdelosporangium philippinense]
MRARDVMSTDLVTVKPSTSAKQAAKLMVDNGFTTLPVVGADGRMVGVVTEIDLLRDRIGVDPRALIHPDWPVHAVGHAVARTVDAVMTTEVLTRGPNADAAQLARDMLDHHLRTIPIEDEGKLVGIVTRRDLLRTVARDDETIVRDVRRHLCRAFRRGDWSASVVDGVATLIDDYDNAADRHIAEVIAGAVPGVLEVHVRARSNAVVP